MLTLLVLKYNYTLAMIDADKQIKALYFIASHHMYITNLINLVWVKIIRKSSIWTILPFSFSSIFCSSII